MRSLLLSCGDALIDMVPARTGDGRPAFAPIVGGSCLNIAIAMARLGANSGLVGGVSTDSFGQAIAGHMAASGVRLDFITRSPAETTLAFVHLSDGEASYSFYDQGSAARTWTYAAGAIPFDQVAAIHVGSTTLINDPASGAALAMVAEARAGGTTISFDPNCRPALVADRADYGSRMAGFMAQADIVRMSDDDFAYLFGAEPHDDRAQALLGLGARLVVLTRGGAGVTAWHKRAGRIEMPAARVAVADTVGAGDTFLAALLVALQEGGWIDREALATMDEAALTGALDFAARCAAITCSRPGADPPWRAELESKPNWPI